jgi:hypothetical protein
MPAFYFRGNERHVTRSRTRPVGRHARDIDVLSAPDGADDFQAVAARERRIRITAARDHLAVPLHCDALALEPETGDEIGHRSRVLDVPGDAVHGDGCERRGHER